MAKWARVQDGLVAEVVGQDPAGRFHPDIEWRAVPAHLEPWVRAGYLAPPQGGVAPPSLEHLKGQLLADLASRRFAGETAGILVAGNQIATDRESQSLVSDAASALADGIVASIRFKTKAGPRVTADAPTMAAIRVAVVQHVQAWRTAEADHADAVEALSDEVAVATYPRTTGWPA